MDSYSEKAVRLSGFGGHRGIKAIYVFGQTNSTGEVFFMKKGEGER